jgi:ADP-ribose pyrophosphatase
VLLYDPAADAVVLVRQFRYPVYESLGEAARGPGARAAWILEIVAGVLEWRESVPQVADRELLEEAGYRIAGDPEPIAVVYASPGGTSERIHIFLGHVDHTAPAEAGGGVAAEGEDIQVVTLPLADALAAIADGRIADAKTIIALQHLALRKAAGA